MIHLRALRFDRRPVAAPTRSDQRSAAGRHSRRNIARSTGLGCAAAIAAVGLAGCASDVAASDIEETITSRYAEMQTPVREVSCPEDLSAEVGATLICEISFLGQTPGGFEYDRIRVEVSSTENNTVYYDLVLLGVGQPDDVPADGQNVEPNETQDDAPADDPSEAPTEDPTEGG